MNHANMLHAMFSPIEVIASIVIAIVASYAALALSTRVGSRTGLARAPWLIGGGLAVGLGIAGMHFVGMLAMRLDAPVTYDGPLTLLSFAVAIVASTSALAAATTQRLRLRPMFFASTAFGGAVAGMHYIGMSAMRGPFAVEHDPLRVSLSIVVAIVASAAAFWLANRLHGVAGARGFFYQLGSATVMGFAVAGMHYTALSAVTFTARPLAPGDDVGELVGHELSILVAIVGLVVLAAAILVAMVDQRARQAARDAALSNERYREMADAMPQIVWTALGDGSVDYVNSRWFEYTGDIRGPRALAEWSHAIHPDDADAVRAQWKNAVATGEEYKMEYRLRRSDGDYHWHLGRGVPLRDGAGTIVKWFGTLTDIHEQKLAQAVLRAHQATLESQIVETEAEVERARALYQLLAENATDMVSTHRRDGTFDYATPSWVEYLGESTANQLPIAWSHEDDRGQLIANHLAAFSSDSPLTTTWRCRRADGTFGWLETRTGTVRQPDTGEVVTFVCATRDITQAKRDELAMRESEDKYRQLVEQAADAILLVDANGACIAANRRAELLAGVEPSALVGRVLGSSVTPSGVSKDMPSAHVRTTSGVTIAEYDFRRDDGTVLPIEASIATLADGRVQIIARDISSRRELERLKDEFVSIVSHELRTPLTSIRGALGLLESGKLAAAPEKAHRMLTVAVSNTDRLIRLINDILDFERIDSGTLAMDFAWCSARNIATQVIEALQPVADQSAVRLMMQGTDLRVWADVDRLTQTLTNLVSNAIKFSERNSVVAIAFSSSSAGIDFEVRDSGRGIPADKLESIFERFQQVDASDARQKGGSGLGLAICRSIVLQHGGRIWAENNASGGSVFKFVLPHGPADVGETRSLASNDLYGEHRASRVLVIEDDVTLAQVTALALESRGLSVATAHSGGDALQWIARSSPDILIVDLGLPDMGGLDVIAKIRQHTAGINVRTIVYTAADPGPAARERIKALGAELATKSRVSVEALVERVVDLSGRATVVQQSSRLMLMQSA
jgi:PAS domain S-box-containing protein